MLTLGTALLIPAAAVSWWSISTYAQAIGLPSWAADVVSVAVDGVGLYAGLMTWELTRAGHPARLARVVTYAAVTLSVYLNVSHGASADWTTSARVLVSTPMVVATALFELVMRKAYLDERDAVEAPVRTRRGARVGWAVRAWHPLETLRRQRAEALRLLDEVIPAEGRNQGEATVRVAETVTDRPRVLAKPAERKAPERATETGPVASVLTDKRATMTAQVGVVVGLIQELGAPNVTCYTVMERLGLGESTAKRSLREARAQLAA
jgi:hypothetical protein